MTKFVKVWAGKMPIDTLKLLDTAGYKTEDGDDMRIRFRMDLNMFDLIHAGTEGVNDFANDAILGGELAGTGLSDIHFHPVAIKEAIEDAGFCTGSVTLEIDASVKDVIEYLNDEG